MNLIKVLLSVLLITSIGATSIYGQLSQEYLFDQSRVLLAQRKIDEAIVKLRKIYVRNPNNANINFLMGAAYTELPGTQEEAMFHLKKAVQNVSEDYEVGSFDEKGAPIHVYYYLAVALVEKDRCSEANNSFKQFKKYADKVDAYFIDEVDRHLQKCPFEESDKGEKWNKIERAPANYDPTFIPPEPKFEVDSSLLAEKGLVTERLEYTTDAPLYGVQIGSNRNPSPTSSYSNVRNVDVFIDTAGMIRYVIGHFSYRKQAESLLKSIQEKGFKDAYIVNVNDERKYSNEVISYKNINLRAGLRGRIEYYVQLGAFNDTIPQAMLDLYFKVDGIKEFKKEDKTILTLGSFDKYKKAVVQKSKMIDLGVSDAFIVAYNKGKVVPLDEAINHTDGAIEKNKGN